MWLPILLVAAVLGCYESLKEPKELTREIVGGVETTIDKIPYQLAMEIRGRFICGGSIISKNWALSAAHCVRNRNPKNIRLRSGSSILGKDGQLHQVVETIIHSFKAGGGRGDDIALLRVSTPFNKTQIIGLAKVRPAAGTNSSVSGWGDTVHGSQLGSKHLLRAYVPIFDQARCVALNAVYKITVTDRMICTGFPLGGKGPCQGDSGGPLVVKKKLVGIVSKGYKCAKEGPAVYVDVAALRSWIVEKIGSG